MKKIGLFFLFPLLLVGCAVFLPGSGIYASSFSAETITTDYYEEWGIIRSTAHGVVVKKNGSFEPTEASFNKVCGELFGGNDFYAGRIFLDDSSGKTSIECFARPSSPVNSEGFVRQLILRSLGWVSNKWIAKDSVFQIIYGGDSVQVVSGLFFNHKKVCAETNKNDCSFDADFEKQRADIYFDGPFYEISLPATGRVRSLTIRKKTEKFDRRYPFVLDSAILPLESPGYKKLREQEESLGNRF